MNELSQKLGIWLERHDFQIDRFRNPIPISDVCNEIGVPFDRVLGFFQQNNETPFYQWSHTHGSRASRSKPYCLRLNGPDTVGLDWEDSVIGAAEAAFRMKYYQTSREIGTEEHICSLIANPDLSIIDPKQNKRDLWALRRDEKNIELYIIEAKGKQAYGFDHYCFAEALSQVFPVPREPLSMLLGAQKEASQGLCWQYARRLYHGWESAGLRPNVTVAVLVPEWSPDVVWSSNKVQHIPGCFYERPLAAFRRFLATGETDIRPGAYKYQRAFGEILNHLETNYHIRSLAHADKGLRFRVLTARFSAETGACVFELHEEPSSRWGRSKEK